MSPFDLRCLFFCHVDCALLMVGAKIDEKSKKREKYFRTLGLAMCLLLMDSVSYNQRFKVPYFDPFYTFEYHRTI